MGQFKVVSLAGAATSKILMKVYIGGIKYYIFLLV